MRYTRDDVIAGTTAGMRESKRKHKIGCDYLVHPKLVTGSQTTGEPCTCGADEWNAKVDAVLEGVKK